MSGNRSRLTWLNRRGSVSRKKKYSSTQKKGFCKHVNAYGALPWAGMNQAFGLKKARNRKGADNGANGLKNTLAYL